MLAAGRVVVPEEVEEPMNYEVGNLAGVRPLGGTRLHPGALERDVDFSEKYRRRGINGCLGITERKRKDVGRCVGFAIVAIQPADEVIPREDHRDRRPRAAESPQGGADQRPKSGQS